MEKHDGCNFMLKYYITISQYLITENENELYLIFQNLETFITVSLREKCQNTELFLVRSFLYLDWIQENTDQKQLRIWTLFMQRLIWVIEWIKAVLKYTFIR